MLLIASVTNHIFCNLFYRLPPTWKCHTPSLTPTWCVNKCIKIINSCYTHFNTPLPPRCPTVTSYSTSLGCRRRGKRKKKAGGPTQRPCRIVVRLQLQTRSKQEGSQQHSVLCKGHAKIVIRLCVV